MEKYGWNQIIEVLKNSNTAYIPLVYGSEREDKCNATIRKSKL